MLYYHGESLKNSRFTDTDKELERKFTQVFTDLAYLLRCPALVPNLDGNGNYLPPRGSFLRTLVEVPGTLMA
jgi:hypothetical protein